MTSGSWFYNSSIFLFKYSSIYIYLSVYLSIFLSIHPSIYLSIHLSIYLPIHIPFYLPIYLYLLILYTMIGSWFYNWERSKNLRLRYQYKHLKDRDINFQDDQHSTFIYLSIYSNILYVQSVLKRLFRKDLFGLFCS